MRAPKWCVAHKCGYIYNTFGVKSGVSKAFSAVFAKNHTAQMHQVCA
ncbi:hypothetical protein X564_19370 [Pseudoalteromonas agarivorans]|nr:hypothetical protein X564_19370 [Pseudoalteromonas agarivorans]